LDRPSVLFTERTLTVTRSYDPTPLCTMCARFAGNHLQSASHSRVKGLCNRPEGQVKQLTRARSILRITVPNAAYDGCHLSGVLNPIGGSNVVWFRRSKFGHRCRTACSGRVHLIGRGYLNSIPSGKSGPTGMYCSSIRFSFESGRLSMRARASATSWQFSMKITPLPSPRVNHC